MIGSRKSRSRFWNWRLWISSKLRHRAQRRALRAARVLVRGTSRLVAGIAKVGSTLSEPASYSVQLLAVG
jgi:hypothetical protein